MQVDTASLLKLYWCVYIVAAVLMCAGVVLYVTMIYDMYA